MSTIKDLIKAHRMLEEAGRLLPAHVTNATLRVQKKLGIGWVEALEVVDTVYGHPAGKLGRTAKPSKRLLKAKRAGFGGHVKPKTLDEIEARAEKAIGEKRDRYMAAAALVRKRGEWVRGDEMKKLGINLDAIRNIKQMTSYLPTGLIVRAARGKGYMAQSLQEALS